MRKCKIVICLLMLIAPFIGFSQSPFKPEPKLGYPTERVGDRVVALATALDTTVNVWRFGVTVSPVGYTFAGTYQASAGIEFGYQHQTYTYATQAYKVLWSVNGVWIPINTATPVTSIKDLETVGALFGFDNNLIQVGPFVNPNTPGPFKNKAGIWAVLGINLN